MMLQIIIAGRNGYFTIYGYAVFGWARLAHGAVLKYSDWWP